MDKDDKDKDAPRRGRSRKDRAATSLPSAAVAPSAAERGQSLAPGPAATLPPTLSPTTAAVDLAAHADPLREFLASYDEGDEVVARASAEGAAVVEEDKRFLSFDLGGEVYAASIMDVREILKIVTPTEVPRAPREVLGVLSKRGVVMPVVDLAAVLGLRAPDRALHRDQRVLVVGDGQRVLGLRVDRVRQVVRLPARGLEEVPASLGNKGAHMLLGLGRPRVDPGEESHMLILLDVDAVLVHVADTMGVVLKESA